MNLKGYYRSIITILRRSTIVAAVLSITAISSFSQSLYQLPAISAPGDFSEEVYLRTDRDIYIAGEQVYLKIFCLNSLTHRASAMSRVAYINLLDRNNNPVISLKAGISGMSGTASLALPDTLGTGNYFLAASTRWMQNYSPELYSYKTISVVNPFRNIDSLRAPAIVGKADKLTFFPEGGAIIAGSANVIGFRCLDAGMHPVSFRGIITDSMDNILCHVRSDNNGFGIIRTVVPSTGRLYLRPADQDTEPVIHELPAASDSSVAIMVTDDAAHHLYRVRINRGPDFSSNNRVLNLVYAPMSTPPVLLYTEPLTKEEILINHNALPEGLAFICLADEKGKVYTGRWLYNDREQVMHIAVKSDHERYGARDKASIDVYAEDSEGNAVAGDLVVTVVRRHSLIESVEAPGCSLQITGMPEVNDSCGIRGINDRLLFFRDTPEALRAETREQLVLPEPDGHIISGMMMRTGTGESLAGNDIVLSFVGKKALCKFATTDDYGRFMFVSNEEGVLEMVIQPMNSDTIGYYVELYDPFPGTFSKTVPWELEIDTGHLDMINKSVISTQINRVYAPFIRHDTTASQSNSGHDFYGKPESVTDLSAFIKLTTLGEALKELVPGAVSVSEKGRAVIKTVRRYNDLVEVSDPIVIVDGVPVPDHEKVLSIPGDKIAEIKVLNNKYYISGLVLGGVIDITTFEGDLSVIRFDKPVFRQEYHGLTGGNGFFSPDYSLPVVKESRIPDSRNTLYWDPRLRTDSTGRAVVEFFTSDEPGEYEILVEGFTPDGIFGRGMAYLTIENRDNKESVRQ